MSYLPNSSNPEPDFILPFEFLKVGESFWIPTLRPAELMYVIDTKAKDVGVRIKAYVMPKDGYMGIRVWRLR
jgi:hypothetical protein